MTTRDERIRKATDQFVNALLWRVCGLPIIVCAALAAGFLVFMIISLFEQ